MLKFLFIISLCFTALFGDRIHLNLAYGQTSASYQSATKIGYETPDITSVSGALGYQWIRDQALFIRYDKPLLGDKETFDIYSLNYRLYGMNKKNDFGLFVDLIGAYSILDDGNNNQKSANPGIGASLGLLMKLTDEHLYYEMGVRYISNELLGDDSAFLLKNISGSYFGFNFKF
jgi:hypothetical protein